MKRSSVISLRMDNDILDKIEQKAKEKSISVSKAIRDYTELGIFAESLKHEIKIPSFMKTIEEINQNDGLFQWIETLSEDQADAISKAIQYHKDRRYQQTRFNSEIKV